MRDTSIKVTHMAEAVWYIQMGKYTKESGTWIKHMALAYIFIKMGLPMKVNGKRIYNREKAQRNGQTDRKTFVCVQAF